MEHLRFIRRVLHLKEIERTGWKYKDIPHPESVADHSFGVALLAVAVPLPKSINRNKVIKMALLHDIGESVIGDRVWESGKFSNIEKHKVKLSDEKKAIHDLFENTGLPNDRDLVLEFLEQKTLEAKFVKELDKLDMILQALVYESRVNPQQLDEFWENAEKYISNPMLKQYLHELQKERLMNGS